MCALRRDKELRENGITPDKGDYKSAIGRGAEEKRGRRNIIKLLPLLPAAASITSY